MEKDCNPSAIAILCTRSSSVCPFAASVVGAENAIYFLG